MTKDQNAAHHPFTIPLLMNAPKVGGAAQKGVYRIVERVGTASTGRAIKVLKGAARDSATRAQIGRAVGGKGVSAGNGVLLAVEITVAVGVGAAIIGLEARRQHRLSVEADAGSPPEAPNDGQVAE
jgi:hypothetical protein